MASKWYQAKTLLAIKHKNEEPAVVSIPQYSKSTGDGTVVWTAARKDMAFE
jgi:hypothetical protein